MAPICACKVWGHQLLAAISYCLQRVSSPDGKLIAVERKIGSICHIWIMNTDGSAQWQLTSDGKQNLCPAWSPDGSEIAYTSDRGGGQAVWICPLDKSEAPRRLSPGEGFDAAWSRR
jgi:Tol biopolymer transport system component